MTTVAVPTDSRPAARFVGTLVIVVHLGLASVAPLATASGVAGTGEHLSTTIVLASVVAVLHLHHSLAVIAGVPPRAWPVTLTAMVVLVYGAMTQLGWPWTSSQWFVIASAALLLRGPLLAVGVAGPIIGTVVAGPLTAHLAPAEVVYHALFWTVGLGMGAACLFGVVHTAVALRHLTETRDELARLAAYRERRRLARDLHDLLGQRLSAVSLKGDLAVQYLDRCDTPAAQQEIRDMSRVARSTLHEVRTVTYERHDIDLDQELDEAQCLLTTAHIDTRVYVEAIETIPERVRAVLGWGLREAVSNMLRHSRAGRCDITLSMEYDAARLVVVNDGADQYAAPPGGLRGLSERARQLGGTVAHGRVGEGWFRLEITIPVTSR